MDPLIISCAVTGALATPQDNPHLPFDPEAIGRACVEAARVGAAIVHIHARADDGTPAWEPEYFQRSLDVIDEAGCDVVVNLTTSWGGTVHDTPWERRFAPLELRPEIVSFDCGTMNFGPFVFHNAPDFLTELGHVSRRRTSSRSLRSSTPVRLARRWRCSRRARCASPCSSSSCSASGAARRRPSGRCCT